MKPEEVIFADVLALPPTERAGFLARTCGTDETLRRRVELLLCGFDAAGPVLERRPAGDASGATRANGESVVMEYAAGMRIGRYKLLQELGEGGCGVVFMAEQGEPVRRRVAIKVIKLGMDTREVIARFEAERQALALMDHPNIAHVLEAGATDSGRPFFVMELVRGTPITRYCDEHGVDTEARLQLFVQVCQAVQHAHQKGIIHRDLKPSNILVTLHDGVPVPKVIDFGIAKATQGRLTDKTLFTAFEQFIGTPAYMAPEQAEMNAYDVDTRSDIYSLGVLLYELLTGRTPFESQELARAGLDEMRRIIREREPPRPSTRLSSIDLATSITIARQRGTEPARLNARLRGDLDWIVMRCLEKDRTRRYETANSLAQDLVRHQRGEPVAARPPSAAYLLQRLFRRNKLAFVAAGAVVAALAIGLVFALLALRREHVARERAAAEAARSAQVARFMRSMLAGVGPQQALGRDTLLLKTILDDTVVRMSQDLQDQPDVEADLRATLGEVYDDLGEETAAMLMHERALALRRDYFGEEHPAVAASMQAIGELLVRQRRFEEAETVLAAALKMQERLLGPDDQVTMAARAAHAHLKLMRGDPTDASGQVALPGASRPEVIRVASVGGMANRKPVFPTILSAAFQEGTLEREFAGDGIRIDWSFPSNYLASETYAHRLADFTSMGPVTAVETRARGQDYKILLALRRIDATFVVVVRAESPFQTLADLRGRRVGVRPGNLFHLTLCRMLAAHGLGPQDVEIVPLAGQAAIDLAFAAGEVDARLLDLDEPARAVENPVFRILFDPRGDPAFATTGKLCVLTEFEQRHPEIVQRVVTNLVRTAAWMSDPGHRSEVLEAWATSAGHLATLESTWPAGKIKSSVSPLMDDLFLAELRRDVDDLQQFGLVQAAPGTDWGFDGWVEPKYLRRALADLGLEKFWSESDDR